jgi:hypothetical protein
MSQHPSTHVTESAELAALLMRKASLAEGLAGRKVVLHSDNGSAMKGATMLATLEKLGAVPAGARPESEGTESPSSDFQFLRNSSPRCGARSARRRWRQVLACPSGRQVASH